MSVEVDRYLAAQSPAFRPALDRLRQDLRALLPDHIECLSYAMPGLRQPGTRGRATRRERPYR